MNNNLTKGIIIGSIVGASVSMMMETDNKSRRNKKMMKAGRYLVKRSGNIIGEVMNYLR